MFSHYVGNTCRGPKDCFGDIIYRLDSLLDSIYRFCISSIIGTAIASMVLSVFFYFFLKFFLSTLDFRATPSVDCGNFRGIIGIMGGFNGVLQQVMHFSPSRELHAVVYRRWYDAQMGKPRPLHQDVVLGGPFDYD